MNTPTLPGWDDDQDDGYGREATSKSFGSLPEPIEVTDLDSLRLGDPGLFKVLDTLVSAMENDMLPEDAQRYLVSRMSSSVKREVVMQIAGLDASILMTFKSQLQMVDAVLRRVVNPDGTKSEMADALGVSVKDAMNMSIKLSTTMTRELPKLYKIDRVQRMEAALFDIVEKYLDREQQGLVLKRLEELNMEAEQKAERGAK